VDLENGMQASVGPDGPVATRQDGLVVAYDHDGNVRWRQSLAGGFAAAPVVATDGTVVVGTREGTVAAYDSDGTERWRAETPQGVYAPHANDATPFRIVEDAVVLAHPRAKAFAFALADGTVRWETETEPRCHRPQAANGRVYFTSSRQQSGEGSVVFALSVSDGSEVWRREVSGSISIGPGLHDAVLYTADIQGTVRALSADDGSDLWKIQLPDDPWISTIPTVFAGYVWVGTLSEGVYALDESGVAFSRAVESPTTPAVGDGRIYFGTSEFGGEPSDPDTPGGLVVAFDDSGTEQWRTQTRGFPDAQVLFRDGRVVVGTETGTVSSFDAVDGSRRWRVFQRPARLPSPVVGDAAVYCGGRDSWLSGYRVTDGTSHLWTVSYDGPVPGTPVSTADGVIGGSLAGDVASTQTSEYIDPPRGRLTRTPTPGPDDTPTPHIDAPSPQPTWTVDLGGPVRDVGYGSEGPYLGSGTEVVAMHSGGDVRWRVELSERVREAPAVQKDEGAVYVTTETGTVVSLDTADGTERWRRGVGKRATAPVLAESSGDGDDPLLVVGSNRRVVAFDPDTGEERWRTETGRVRGTPAVADGTVVVGDSDGVLRGLALADGSEQWRVEADGAIHGSPAVADGTAYVGTRGSRLLAVAVADGTVAWRVQLADWVDGSPAVAYGAVFVVDQSGTLSAVVGEE
jgi:outer membrane protein assembly factor BamB